MKRTLLLSLTALAALLASSCQKDDLGRVLTATIEQYEHNASSKAYINTENYACWENNDKVNINGHDYTISISGGNEHNYSASIPGTESLEGDLLAFYPASSIDGTTVTFPYVQEYNTTTVNNVTYQKIQNPMAAYCPMGSNELKFRNLGALLKVTLKPASTIQVRAIEVKGVDDQMLWGKAQLTNTSNGQPMLESLTDGGNSVVLHFGTPQEVTSAGREFYIVMPANTNFYNLTIAVISSENSTYSHHCKTSKIGEVLGRNHIGAITYDLSHNDDNFLTAWMIHYTAVLEVTLNDLSGFGANIISHTFDYPNGIIFFDNLVTGIGDSVFMNEAGLYSITLPESITTIGDSAFRRCSNLSRITLPTNLTTIGENAFERCSGLYSITLPKGLTSIENAAFANCFGLTSIDLSLTGVTSIGKKVFADCRSLTDITFPQGLTSIGDAAFSGCSNLDDTELLPANLMSIGNRAFAGCTKFSWISLPASLIEIGDDAFSNCSMLYAIEAFRWEPGSTNKITRAGRNMFEGCLRFAGIKVLPDAETTYKNDPSWSDYSDKIYGILEP